MNIHEYQAKEVLKSFGAVTLKGKVASTPEEAVDVANEIGGQLWVVKAQIHAGGREQLIAVAVVAITTAEPWFIGKT